MFNAAELCIVDSAVTKYLQIMEYNDDFLTIEREKKGYKVVLKVLKIFTLIICFKP